ncbi:MAG TPA: CARDB domain-containing protein, partial [Planctomycetaceae bacterium]|nr:CARDB domain-containing protein [Planctomycetaceae bacterium]
VLQLTVRQIGNNPVGRTKNFNVPALAAGKTSVVTVDAASILPNTVALKSTTFRVDADQTKVVAESDETNNLEWHKP